MDFLVSRKCEVAKGVKLKWSYMGGVVCCEKTVEVEVQGRRPRG